jgi:hypothetical protein
MRCEPIRELEEDEHGTIWLRTLAPVRSRADVPDELEAEYEAILAERERTAGEDRDTQDAAYYERLGTIR